MRYLGSLFLNNKEPKYLIIALGISIGYSTILPQGNSEVLRVLIMLQAAVLYYRLQYQTSSR